MGVANGPIPANGSILEPVGDDNVVGGIPVIYRVPCTDATANHDVVVTEKIRVIDGWFVKTAGNGSSSNTVTIQNSTSAITDAMDANINDTLNVRAAQINDANHEIDAGGTLRVAVSKSGGNAAGIAYVLAIRVA